MGAEVAGKQNTCKNCNLSLDFGLDQDHVQGQTLKAKAKAYDLAWTLKAKAKAATLWP